MLQTTGTITTCVAPVAALAISAIAHVSQRRLSISSAKPLFCLYLGNHKDNIHARLCNHGLGPRHSHGQCVQRPRRQNPVRPIIGSFDMEKQRKRESVLSPSTTLWTTWLEGRSLLTDKYVWFSICPRLWESNLVRLILSDKRIEVSCKDAFVGPQETCVKDCSWFGASAHDLDGPVMVRVFDGPIMP